MNRSVCLSAGVALALSARLILAAPPAELNPEHVVRAWAEASQAIAPPGRAAQLRTLHAHRAQLNGHQIALINEFRSPVDADDLLARYHFTAAERDGDAIRIAAVPRDVVERLFVERFEVSFIDDSYLPLSLNFHRRGDDEPLGSPITLIRRSSSTVTAVNFDADDDDNQRGSFKTAAASSLAGAEGSSQRLREVLDGWKRNASRVTNVRVEFVRFEYDHVFHVEKRAKGTLLYRTPDKGRIDVEPGDIQPSEKSEVTDGNGTPYRLQKDLQRETQIWTGDKCYHVNHAEKVIFVYSKLSSETGVRRATFSTRIADAFFQFSASCLPMFATWLPSMETDFKWSLVKETSSQFQLKGVPENGDLKSQYAEIGLVLDAGTFRVRAVKFVDPSRLHETVYLLQNARANIDEAVEFIDARRIEPPDHPGYEWSK